MEKTIIDRMGEKYKKLEEAVSSKCLYPGLVYVILDCYGKLPLNGDIEEVLKEAFGKKQFLELGCANGKLFPFFEGYGAFIEGMDLNWAAVEEAKKLGRRVHWGDIDDPDGAIGQIKGRLDEDSEQYDAIFSCNVWTPSAITMEETIKNFVEIPMKYTKPGSFLIHYSNKGLHEHVGNFIEKGIITSLKEYNLGNGEVAKVWRKIKST